MLIEKYHKVCLQYYSKIKSNCKECNGTGYLYKEGRTYKDCKCTKLYEKIKEFIKYGMNPDFLNSGMFKWKDDFEKKELERLDKLKTYLITMDEFDRRGNVLIHLKHSKRGNSEGVMKWLHMSLINAKHSAIYINAIDLMKYLSDYTYAPEITTELDGFEYLIIDNFGDEWNKYLQSTSTFQCTQLLGFLNGRLSDSKKTIIKFNKTIEEIKELYASELFDLFFYKFLRFEIESKVGIETALYKLNKSDNQYSDLFTDGRVGSTKKPKGVSKTKGRKIL